MSLGEEKKWAYHHHPPTTLGVCGTSLAQVLACVDGCSVLFGRLLPHARSEPKEQERRWYRHRGSYRARATQQAA